MQPRIPHIVEPIYQFKMQRILGSIMEESLMTELDIPLKDEKEFENLSYDDEEQS